MLEEVFVARTSKRGRHALIAVSWLWMGCLAWGCNPQDPGLEGRAFVYNATDQLLAVEIGVNPWLNCGALDRYGAKFLQQSDFVSTGFVRLAPAAVTPLRDVRTGDDENYFGGCSCLYRVSIGGRRIVVRTESQTVAVDRHPTQAQYEQYREHMLVVGDDISFHPGSKLPTVKVRDTAKQAPPAGEPRPMTFSTGLAKGIQLMVSDVEPVAGNCFDITLEVVPPASNSTDTSSTAGAGGASGIGGQAGAGGTAGGAGNSGAGGALGGSIANIEHAYVCAPLELFPFNPGDYVDLEASQVRHGYGNYSTLSLHSADRQRGFLLLVGNQGTDAPWQDYSVRDCVDGCDPVRTEDERPWLPVVVERDSQLEPGRITPISDGNKRGLVVYLGRNRQYLTAACGAYQTESPWLEIAEGWSL